MNGWKIVFVFLAFLALATSAACASGEQEEDPVFDPARPGWQSVSVYKGFDHIQPASSRMYHAYFKSISTMKKGSLDILTRDFIGRAFELYASTGVGFKLKREKGAGWKATLGMLKGQAETALLRAVVYKKQDYGDNRLVTYKVSSYDRPFPMWKRNGKNRYVFQGVWNLIHEQLPPNGAIDLVLTRALERMAGELGPGQNPPLVSGRLYLAEFRFLYVSRDRLVIFCRLAVEGDE